MAANDKSRKKLIGILEDEVTNLFERVLDYAQVACPTKDTYSVLRSKILRVGNDCKRNMGKIVSHYDVEFIPQSEEIIEIKQPVVIRK
jgi:hypothetical protein